ncbi:uncharacterized protein LOC142984262 [Anticarsia gemmatalis]|uniref:uncharacterized protein LOC142984262 n=1 Tax=Anticarsia gemmatalis TaxID=129554 RepID=UPI003F773B90
MNYLLYRRISGDVMAQRRQMLRSSVTQINMLADYMVTNKDFANATGAYDGTAGAKKAAVEWEALRQRLNQYGVDKTVVQWKQTWRDLKRKARWAVSKNKDQIPVVSDITYKILETMSSASMEYPVSVEEDKPPADRVLCDWNDENSILKDNGAESDHNRQNDDGNSDASSTPDEEENKTSLVQVIVPQKDYEVGTSDKSQNDPLLAPQPKNSSERGRRSHLATTRRRRLLLAHRRRTQNIFQQTSNDLVSLEHRRLRFEEERDRRLHEREMERLKLELQRIEVQRNHNELLQHLVNIAQNACELLQRNLP